jgi:hypothetical protein
MKNPGASCGASSKEKAKMGVTIPIPPLAPHLCSELQGILAFSHMRLINEFSE